MEQTEAQIISRFHQGETEAFGELYDLYSKQIFAFVVYRVNNRQAAEDLTSDIFMKALQAMPQFDEIKASFRTWVYTIARNRIIDYYRTNKTTDTLEVAMTFESDSRAQQELEARERRELLAQLLERLSPPQRDLVIMRVWDGLSYKEIATITGEAEVNLKMQFSRALKKLTSFAPLAVLLVQIINH